MTFALFLVGLFALFQLPLFRTRLPSQRDRAAWAAGLFFIVAGALHFVTPGRYLAMMPPFLPAPELLVWLSGLAEMACGAALLPRRTRRPAAWATIALLIAILPANVYVALSGQSVEGLPSNRIYYLVRVPIQLVYVAWVAWAGGLVARGKTSGSNTQETHIG